MNLFFNLIKNKYFIGKVINLFSHPHFFNRIQNRVFFDLREDMLIIFHLALVGIRLNALKKELFNHQ